MKCDLFTLTSSRGVAIILILLGCVRCDAPAQDILGYLLSGKTSERMIGGNIFSSLPEEMTRDRGVEQTVMPSMEYDYHFDDIFHQTQANGSDNFTQGYSRSLRASLPLTVNQFPSLLQVGFYSTTIATGISQDTGEAGNYSSSNVRMTFSYSMHLNSSLSVRTEFSQLSDGHYSSMNGNGTLTLTIDPQSKLSLSTGNIGSFNLLQLEITGVDGVLPLHIRKSGYSLSAYRIWRGITLFGKFEHSSLLSVPERTDVGDTRFLPHGKLAQSELNARFDFAQNLTALIGVNGMTIDGEASFLSGVSSYGSIRSFQLNDKEIHAGLLLTGANHKLYTADVQWRQVEGGMNGYIESWPFVSIFQSLVTTREYYNVTGALQFAKFHIGGYFPLSDKFTIGLGNNFFHILPSLSVETWQPKYIIFGVRAYAKNELSVQSLDLMVLSGGIRASLNKFGISYSINQMVPLHIVKIAAPASEALPSVPPSGGSSPQSSASGSGGQFHQLSLSYAF